MASIFRVVTEWSGFNGAPGYTNFYFRNVLPDGAPTGIDNAISAAAGGDRTQNLWNALKGQLPDEVTLQVQNTVDELEDTTGALIDSYSFPPTPAVRGTDSATYSVVTGAVIGWKTGTIRRRRRIQGRTFIVPLAGFSFGSTGRITNTDVGVIQAAATAFANGGINSTFGVWARPSEKGASDGQWAPCTSARVTNLPAVLRSRRD